ncbi:ATP-binding protein [Thermococcus litoralis]|uniref:ATP-binding protein n=1 Tax=Thermococcus litoralis TaxID=2265 RepID=UPI000B34E149|nr:ATP-binding protein [Thermococcus litoralis]
MEDLMLLQNPWWRGRDEIYKDDKVKAVLSKKSPLKYFFEKKNKVIIGPRQVGKTTYLKLCILDLLEKGVDPRNILYFSCDLLRGYREIIEVIRTFGRFSMGEKYIFLDEVTFVDEWERAVKFFLDSPLSQNAILYATGSTSAGIKRESFPGRPIKIEEFLPLSFRKVFLLLKPEFKEVLERIKTPKTPKEAYKNALELYPYYDEFMNAFYFYLRSGGYPRAIYELMEGEITPDTYEMIYNATIFDVAKVGRSERIALSIILGILRRYGDRISLNSLAKELEIGAHTTVRDYLELFEELFISRNYFQVNMASFAPLLRKERKVYFIDPLVVNTFSRHFGFEVELPKKVEGVVGEHLKRNFETYFFYGNKEVDFVTKIFGVEVKWQNKVKASDFPRVGIKNKLLLSKKDMEFVEGRNLAIIPVPLFLIQLP